MWGERVLGAQLTALVQDEIRCLLGQGSRRSDLRLVTGTPTASRLSAAVALLSAPALLLSGAGLGVVATSGLVRAMPGRGTVVPAPWRALVLGLASGRGPVAARVVALTAGTGSSALSVIGAFSPWTSVYRRGVVTVRSGLLGARLRPPRTLLLR